MPRRFGTRTFARRSPPTRARLSPDLVRLAPSLLLDARARLATFSDPRLVLEGLFFPMFPRAETVLAGARGAGAR